MIYKIYTDGATSNNGYENSRGGFGWVVVANDRLLYYDSDHVTPATNNICELKGMISACHYIDKVIEVGDVVLVYSDSAYIINCYKQGWYKNWEVNGWINSKKQPVANKELWQELIPFFNQPYFKFEKVKGHSTDKWNNLADKLAVQAKNLESPEI